jgi:tRNA pseudouridine38-40 synthase
VRFGYDGSGFSGWARQPGRRTVEGELRRGLVRARMVRTAEDAGLVVASRTDAGVHARGNALALTCALDGPRLLRALNGIAPDVYFTRARAIGPQVSPRRASRRWYRYFEPMDGRSPDRWAEAASLFAGSIDARSFGRGIASSVPSLRPIESVTVTPGREVMAIDVRAPSFVWGMVRKIIAALRAFDRGERSRADLTAAISGERRVSLPLAEADRLVLWEVEYAEPWEFEGEGGLRHQRRAWRAATEGAAARRAVLGALAPLTERSAEGIGGPSAD